MSEKSTGKNPLARIIISSLIVAAFFFTVRRAPPVRFLHWKAYDVLVRTHYLLRNKGIAGSDLVLVVIDNETLNNISKRWPYPRAYFADVITHLKDAGAKAIGIDFVFFGASAKESDDDALRDAIRKGTPTVLASTIDDDGSLNIGTFRQATDAPYGIITKLQDKDGITRKGLTYLVSDTNPKKAFLSWELQLLKSVEPLDFASWSENLRTVSFRDKKQKKWVIPTEPDTRAFLIRFNAHTQDLVRIPFYRVLSGDFDAETVRGRIVLVGFLSSLLGDLHATPLGWLPGLTVNANAFLTLYNRDFTRHVPVYLQLLIAIIAAGAVASWLDSFGKQARFAWLIFPAGLILLFLASCALFTLGLIWNYCLMPLVVLVCPFLIRKVLNIALD